MIHRDIKAANLLTKKVKHGDTEAVVIKLADFGVACTTFEDRSGEAAGSPYWSMAGGVAPPPLCGWG